MFLKLCFLFFAFIVVWVLCFEIIAPLMLGHPIFPSFRRKSKPKHDQRGKKNAK
jgi:hypothetical protein